MFPLLVTEIAKVNCSPTAAGRPDGLTRVFATIYDGATAVWGTLEVEGGTGTLFVVVGADEATFVPVPALTAVNRVVTTVLPPMASGPMFVQLNKPAARLVAFAPGDCETRERRLVLNASFNGTVSSATLPVFDTAIANTNCSPIAAGRPKGLTTVLVTRTPGETTEYGALEVSGASGMPFVVVAELTAVLVEIASAEPLIAVAINNDENTHRHFFENDDENEFPLRTVL